MRLAELGGAMIAALALAAGSLYVVRDRIEVRWPQVDVVSSLSPSAMPAMPPRLVRRNATSCAASRIRKRPGQRGGLMIAIMHVPKAGGTTIRNLLWSVVRQNTSSISKMWEIDGRQCSNRPKARFGLVIGHAGWGFGREYPAKMFNMLLVREPVARALSHANFLHSRRSEYGHRFGDLLVRYNEVRTNAPWMLSAPNVSFALRLPHLVVTDQLSYLASYRCASTNNEKCMPWPDYFSAESPCSFAAMKRQALDHIAEADAIVLAENQDASFRALARFHWGIVFPRASQHLNVRRYGSYTTLNDEEMTLLRSLLQDEMQVYEVAKAAAHKHLRVAKTCLSSAV